MWVLSRRTSPTVLASPPGVGSPAARAWVNAASLRGKRWAGEKNAPFATPPARIETPQ